MIEKEFIPYEQALALKELGFDEPCLMAYIGKGNQLYSKCDDVLHLNAIDVLNPLKAPTFSQVFRWFRERWGYDIHVRGTNFRASYVIGIPKEINMESGDGYPLVIDWDYIVDGTGVRKTYEEAELACLRKLIELIKRNDEKSSHT